jgi:hypothetical protein
LKTIYSAIQINIGEMIMLLKEKKLLWKKEKELRKKNCKEK